MPNPSLPDLRALVQQWREEATKRRQQETHSPDGWLTGTGMLLECADQLEAALLAAGSGERETHDIQKAAQTVYDTFVRDEAIAAGIGNSQLKCSARCSAPAAPAQEEG